MSTDNKEGEKKHQKWFPLESNPELVNEYIRKLGFNTQLGYEFVDVFSTEDWALQMIPQPVLAVIMLYPLTKVQLDHKDDPKQVQTNNPDVWFTKQRIGNACGTVGLLHSLLNAPESFRDATIHPDSWLARFGADTLSSQTNTPVQRAERLEGDSEIASFHDQATSSSTNKTGRGQLEDQLITHFVSLVHVKGSLYELDGRKEGPVCHGPTSPETLLQDACKVVKTFMDRDPLELRFTILALAPSQD
jgi:ubiquitin carboxyl-terminal hydrolase L3